MKPEPAARTISFEQLRAEELRRRYLELIDRPDVFPTRSNWQYITANAMTGLGPALFTKYLRSLELDEEDRQELHQTAIEEFPVYLAAVPVEYAVATVYPALTGPHAREAAELVERCRLFDAAAILELIKNGCGDTALSLIDTYRSEYTPDEVNRMQQLSDYIETMEPCGCVEERTNLLGRRSWRYICPAGHSNDSDAQYCSHSGCGRDIYGRTAEQNGRIETFTERLKALKHLFSVG